MAKTVVTQLTHFFASQIDASSVPKYECHCQGLLLRGYFEPSIAAAID